MIKKIFAVCIAWVSFTACANGVSLMACPQALPTDNAGFCASFEVAAFCHCAESLPSCKNLSMSKIYSLMVAKYGNLANACKAQHDTDSQTCQDDWNCYRNGGTDSHGNACSSTGKTCA